MTAKRRPASEDVVSEAAARAKPKVALALGAGGARGLAHIAALEVLDEMGIRPVAIRGTSIGAIIGAAYAAGMPGAAIRDYVLRMLRDRAAVLGRLLQARVGKLSHLWSRGGIGNPVLIDGERFLDIFWPAAVPNRFEELTIPFSTVATDYYAMVDTRFESGPLVSAVAASMAIPGLIRPVTIDGRVFIDGGAIDPLPFRGLHEVADIVVAVDVARGYGEKPEASPQPFEAMFGASQIMQAAIVAAKVKEKPPDILIRPTVEGFRALDFFKARAILHAAEPAKAALRRALTEQIGAVGGASSLSHKG